jgi:hypothetical protein
MALSIEAPVVAKPEVIINGDGIPGPVPGPNLSSPEACFASIVAAARAEDTKAFIACLGPKTMAGLKEAAAEIPAELGDPTSFAAQAMMSMMVSDDGSAGTLGKLITDEPTLKTYEFNPSEQQLELAKLLGGMEELKKPQDFVLVDGNWLLN